MFFCLIVAMGNVNNDYYDFEERCVNAMLLQATISIVFILIGIGTLLKG